MALFVAAITGTERAESRPTLAYKNTNIQETIIPLKIYLFLFYELSLDNNQSTCLLLATGTLQETYKVIGSVILRYSFYSLTSIFRDCISVSFFKKWRIRPSYETSRSNFFRKNPL